jgi:hypothetical protein
MGLTWARGSSHRSSGSRCLEPGGGSTSSAAVVAAAEILFPRGAFPVFLPGVGFQLATGPTKRSFSPLLVTLPSIELFG